MCYLIAKDTKKHGCFAIKTTHGNLRRTMVRTTKSLIV